MAAKIFFSVLVTLVVAHLASAASPMCADPEASKQLAYTKEVHVEAPSFGRTSTDVVLPKPSSPVTCIQLSGYAASESQGSVSIAAIGLSEEGIAVRLVSNVKQGIDVQVEVFTA